MHAFGALELILIWVYSVPICGPLGPPCLRRHVHVQTVIWPSRKGDIPLGRSRTVQNDEGGSKEVFKAPRPSSDATEISRMCNRYNAAAGNCENISSFWECNSGRSSRSHELLFVIYSHHIRTDILVGDSRV